MKTLTKFLTIATLLSSGSLAAQSTGGAASDATKTAKNNNWQNWVFAGGAAVAAAVGITVVLINTGSTSNSHS